MNFLKKSLLGAAVSAALGFTATVQAGVIVDLFTDTNGLLQSVSVTNLGANQNDQDGPFAVTNVLGGYRDISITKTGDIPANPAFPTPNIGTSTLEVAGGALAFSSASGNLALGVVTWDGNNVAGADGLGLNKTGLGGIDLTYGGSANQFLADIFSADLAFKYKISVWDMDGDKSTLSAGVQFQVFNPGVTSHYNFSWFNLASGTYCDGVSAPPTCLNLATQLDFTIARSGTGDGLIDFTKIGAIQLELQGEGADVDLSLGTIRTVPEPGALALVGFALLGAGVASRRAGTKKG